MFCEEEHDLTVNFNFRDESKLSLMLSLKISYSSMVVMSNVIHYSIDPGYLWPWLFVTSSLMPIVYNVIIDKTIQLKLYSKIQKMKILNWLEHLVFPYNVKLTEMSWVHKFPSVFYSDSLIFTFSFSLYTCTFFLTSKTFL